MTEDCRPVEAAGLELAGALTARSTRDPYASNVLVYKSLSVFGTSSLVLRRRGREETFTVFELLIRQYQSARTSPHTTGRD